MISDTAYLDSLELNEPSSTALTESDGQSSLNQLNANRNESYLPPVDKGFGPWSFLAVGFSVETIVWGFPFAFGTFLDTYLSDPSLASQKHADVLLPLIGTLSTGIIFCSGPLIYPVISRYPHHRRTSMYIGTLLCFASLFGASYARKVYQLLILQGVLFAVGASCLYGPCLSFLPEWFVERRGLATGVMFAGTATGGIILPLVLPVMLNSLGAAKSLRILSIVTLFLLGPLIPLVRSRLPASRVRGPPARATEGTTWLKDKSFCLFMFVNVLQSLAYFVPFLWLPTFASYMNLSKSRSSLALAMLNGATLIGSIGVGFLSDTVSPWTLALAILCTTTFITVVLWGVLSHTAGGLFAFAILYGAVAGGWPSLFSSFVKPIAKDDPKLSTTILGHILLMRGIANIVSTPISTSLFRVAREAVQGNLGFDVDSGRFEKMIIYTGTCFAAASLVSGIGWSMDKKATRAH